MTLADELLKGYEAVFTVRADFGGGVKRYPVWKLMERMLYVTDTHNNKVRFILKRPQALLYKEMCLQRLKGQPVRIDILKARQIGFSTFIAGFCFVMTMFTPNFHSAIMANTEANAHKLFKKYQYFYDHLDDSNPDYEAIRRFESTHKGQRDVRSWKPTLKFARGQEYMETLKGNSSLEVVVAGEAAARGSTYSFFHFSECAFYANLTDTLNAATETVDDNSADTFMFMETTGNGFNEYKDRWDNDEKCEGLWKSFFMPWFKEPRYTATLLPGQDAPQLEPWLLERQKQYGLTDGQMLWYWRKYMDKGKNRSLILQEHPFSPVDAFVSSGSCVFGNDLVAQRKSEILKMLQSGSLYKKRGLFTYRPEFSQDGSRISLSDVGFYEYPSGEVRVFELPIKGHPYVAVCDPNNERNDDTAIQVIDNSNGRQVAAFSSSEFSWDRVAYQLYCLGKMYNWALISNEMNVGKTVMDYLVKMKYPKLYVSQSLSVDDWKQSVSSRYGHIITKGNRPFVLEQMKIAFREDPSMINDYHTILEMESFQTVSHVRNGTIIKKDEAQSGKHDDLVLAFAGFYLVREQQTATIQESEAERTSKMTRQQLVSYYEDKLAQAHRSLEESNSMEVQFYGF